MPFRHAYSLLFTSLFLSSLLFFFQFSLFFLPWYLLIPICGYCSHLYWVNLMRFLYFTPRASPTVFGLQWTPLQSCPPTHWLPVLYHYWTCLVYSLSSTAYYMTNFPFVRSWYKSVWMDKALGFFLTYLSSMHRVVPTIYHLIWAKCHPSKAFS